MEYEVVLKELFSQLFEKVEKEINKSGVDPRANYMADKLFPKSVSSKTYKRYHKRYVEDEYTVGGIPSTEHLNLFVKYLGYKSFASFEDELTSSSKTEKSTQPKSIDTPSIKLENISAERQRYMNNNEEPKVILSDEVIKKKLKK